MKQRSTPTVMHTPIGAREVSRPALILGVLALGCGAFALLQTIVAPALPVLQRDLHTSTSGAAWVFTSFLLASSVATPIAGRLGDMFGKKRVLVISLSLLAAGSFLAALATSLPLLIVARAIQGLGGAVYPLAFGIIRDQLPRERVASAIALVSEPARNRRRTRDRAGRPDPAAPLLPLALLDPAHADLCRHRRCRRIHPRIDHPRPARFTGSAACCFRPGWSRCW